MKILSQDIAWLLKEKYAGEKTPAFCEDVLRLHNGEPLAYIIGHAPFLQCHIDLSKRPLIPRPETEFWMERTLPAVRKRAQASVLREQPVRILDLFSGSGCIGVALLKNVPGITVDFADISAQALQQIAINIEINDIDTNQVRIMQSDVYTNVQGPYDFIFANPPYIDRARNTTDASVLEYEPHEALFAPDHGLHFIRILVEGAAKQLAKGGTMYIEFDSWQKQDLEQLLANSEYNIHFDKDQYGRWRTVALTRRLDT